MLNNNKKYSLLQEALDGHREEKPRKQVKKVVADEGTNMDLDSYLRYLTKVHTSILSYQLPKK